MPTAQIPCAAPSLLVLALALLTPSTLALAKTEGLATEGRLEAMDAKGKALGTCPLKHTDVTADIAGFIARVTVRQQFHNPFAGQDRGRLRLPAVAGRGRGPHDHEGRRPRRSRARSRSGARPGRSTSRPRPQGKVASLLDQERPNIFTQSVANIEPGEQVDITISYSETLKWKDGEYQFSFPMVVGPRYMPGAADRAADDRLGPADRPGARRQQDLAAGHARRAPGPGHDISITVQPQRRACRIRRLDRGSTRSTSSTRRPTRAGRSSSCKQQKTIPNKDFVLVYQTATRRDRRHGADAHRQAGQVLHARPPAAQAGAHAG